MSTVTSFNNLTEVADHFRKDLTGDHRPEKNLVLFFAHNGTGKTRLSMEFKEMGKTAETRDTLYYNAFTEDLFVWNNDLESDTNRHITLNRESAFFEGLRELEMENRIGPIFQNYVDLNFFIDYDNYIVTFSRNEVVDGESRTVENIKISRGEENLFIWCFFVAICQLAMDHVNGEEGGAYSWVKFFYIDDPISSLDENNAISVACDLGKLIRTEGNKIKTVVSTHHTLFFNVMYNELRGKIKNKAYYLRSKGSEGYELRDTGDTPFFHHIAVLNELNRVAQTNQIYTFHFNALRSVLEKTVSFLGYDKIDKCIHGLDDEVLFERALQLFSHGRYSVFDPQEMGDDNKDLFKRILSGFIAKYEFDLHEILSDGTETVEA